MGRSEDLAALAEAVRDNLGDGQITITYAQRGAYNDTTTGRAETTTTATVTALQEDVVQVGAPGGMRSASVSFVVAAADLPARPTANDRITDKAGIVRQVTRVDDEAGGSLLRITCGDAIG